MSISDYSIIKQKIKNAATDFGFLGASIANAKISLDAQNKYTQWLNTTDIGDMTYLKKQAPLKLNPANLVDGTLAIICVKVPYLSREINSDKQRLNDAKHAYISNYAVREDYHKVIKDQLHAYANYINQILQEHNLELKYRAFTDSAPVMEVELAQNSGLGFRGKNTLLIHPEEGSFFFLGELFTNLPLEADDAMDNHCGSCTKCLDICPTNAFSAPYVLDATKCISYLTIENKGAIPIEYRKLIGNRIYGCDDCQLFCPWNKFSKLSSISKFKLNQKLYHLSLIDAFKLDVDQWSELTSATPIARTGYLGWLRNVAIALGNSESSSEIIQTLMLHKDHENEMIREHVAWALSQHQK